MGAGGILLGLFVFKLGGLAIGLGTAGGLLLMGIAIGYLSSLNPTFGRVPGAASLGYFAAPAVSVGLAWFSSTIAALRDSFTRP